MAHEQDLSAVGLPVERTRNCAKRMRSRYGALADRRRPRRSSELNNGAPTISLNSSIRDAHSVDEQFVDSRRGCAADLATGTQWLRKSMMQVPPKMAGPSRNHVIISLGTVRRFSRERQGFTSRVRVLPTVARSLP